jgi:hypothetical protein
MFHIHQKRPFLGEHLRTLLPAMASLALSLPHNKPFLGEQYVPHTAEETFPGGEHLRTLLPAMASLALSLPHSKPFLGELYVPHTAEETIPW